MLCGKHSGLNSSGNDRMYPACGRHCYEASLFTSRCRGWDLPQDPWTPGWP
uniref:Uncharacterized protein n=1 Tax=Anguilla anguilla TaxID=7936 RepID=A0A0E9VHG2_ANGAN